MARGMLIIDGQRFDAGGLPVRNWLDHRVTRFEGARRRNFDKWPAVTEIVVHESVTSSRDRMVRTLQRKGYGVHLSVDHEGTVHQHNDLALDKLAHAGKHNGPSIGIEVINPYYPKYVRDPDVWGLTLRADWPHHGKYVVPRMVQCERVAGLIKRLVQPDVRSLTRVRIVPAVVDCTPADINHPYNQPYRLPELWAGLTAGESEAPRGLAMSRVEGAESPYPGVYAHTYFHHADGAFVVLYAFLRLYGGRRAEDAYAEAVRLARGAGDTVDVSAYVAEVGHG